MQYFFLVAMFDALQKLISKTFHNHRIHALLFAKVIHEFLKVVLQILKDKNQFFISMYNFVEMDDIDMVKFFQNRNLSDCR